MGLHNKRGQAIVEMAIFGSITLLVLGVLISYVQRLNDQQYLQMENFRRALLKANTFQGEESEGPGASVQLVQIQNRQHVDISSGFFKGNSQNLNSFASVFWAVPKVDKDAEMPSQDLKMARINDDESGPQEAPDGEFYVNASSTLDFTENVTKSEGAGSISTVKDSSLKEELTTEIPGVSVTQNLYRDAEGQYRYSKDAPATGVTRNSTWSAN